MPIAQIVDRPYLFPQRCYFTGDGNDRPILDTGKEDADGGRVYISLSFMDELAKAAGYTTLAEAEEIRAENESLKAQLAVLPETIEGIVNDVRMAAARAQSHLLGLDRDDAVLGAPVDPAADPVAE